jgi:hypothetical protein
MELKHQQFPLMTCRPSMTYDRREFCRRFDHPFSSLVETFRSRNDRMSCCQQMPLTMEA